MGHPTVENGTSFAFEPVFLADEAGRPVLVPVVKATYDVTPRGLVLAPEQVPVDLGGEPWGDEETSSWHFEPEGMLAKPATDTVLIGSAAAPRPGTTEMLVTFQVGPLQASARVVGDRAFFKSVGGIGLTRPLAFERMPLRWERAFGGWDRSSPDPRKHEREARNPVGVGFRAAHGVFVEGLRAPNLEDPRRPFKGWGDRPAPVGFGFTSPDWEPRLQAAGTYDQAWQQDRAPLLPRDFNRRFLQSGAPGLVAPGRLRGDETVVVSGVDPAGTWTFRLPGELPPPVTVTHLGQDRAVSVGLDTVIVDADARRVFLLWRGETTVRDPTSVRSIRVGTKAARPRPEPEASV